MPKASKDIGAFSDSLAEGLKFAQGKKANVKVEKIRIKTGAQDIKEARKILRVTQPQFARLFDYSPEAVKKWEQGVNPVPGGVSLWVQALRRDPGVTKQLLHKLTPAH